MQDGQLRPHHDRASINAGSLEGQGLEIFWVEDPVAAFFLHIQGSGQVALEDGRRIRIGYSAQNGHPYRSIGRELIRNGELAREGVSMQSIQNWIRDNPEKGRRLMEKNPSYIFFREVDGEGPIGAQGVALTPLRSPGRGQKVHSVGSAVVGGHEDAGRKLLERHETPSPPVHRPGHGRSHPRARAGGHFLGNREGGRGKRGTNEASRRILSPAPPERRRRPRPGHVTA